MVADRPKLTNCTPDDVVGLFRKLGGFSIKDCRRHVKITHAATGLITTVPRHPRVNKTIVRAIVEDYLVRDLKYKEEDIYKILWC